MLELLVSELGVGRDEVVSLPGPLDLRGLHSIADLPRDDLKYAAFLPSTHPSLSEVETSSPVDVFDSVSRHDVLLHHPYDSFATSVQRFLEQAAADPHVLAIKQTLYRTSGDSPIIDALIDAAEAGKQVLVIVEIKARFDEQANIRWARKLEHAGCHVVYGLVGLKTHCKLSMVVRDEPDGIRRYTHIGTGNYNPKTARLYEDLGLLTADPAVGEDVAHLFNNLSGISRNTTYDGLLVAPRQRARRPDHPDPRGGRQPPGRAARRDPDQGQLGRRRGDHRRALPRLPGGRAGRPARPRHLRAATGRARPVRDDPRALDPGSVPRAQPVFWFVNDGDPLAWIGSADMMHRNLDRRVEVLVRLPEAPQRGRRRRAARPGVRPGDQRLGARRTPSGASTEGDVHLQES